jgi:putative acetyltransferase
METVTLHIRTERPRDADAIHAVVEDAFPTEAEARFVGLVRASPNFIEELSLVAEVDGAIVGHVMISYVGLHDEATSTDRRIACLAPLAVLLEHEGQGIGSQLVRDVTARADSRLEPLVVLQGDPHFYGRLGFEWAFPLDIDMDLPEWAPREAAQVLRLRAYDSSIRGRVVYPPAFDGITDH